MQQAQPGQRRLPECGVGVMRSMWFTVLSRRARFGFLQAGLQASRARIICFSTALWTGLWPLQISAYFATVNAIEQ